MPSGVCSHEECSLELADALCPVQRPKHAASEDLCWQLHPEQLQLASGAMGLVTALTSIPIEADRHLLTIPGIAHINTMTLSRDKSVPEDCILRGSSPLLSSQGSSQGLSMNW